MCSGRFAKNAWEEMSREAVPKLHSEKVKVKGPFS